MSPLAPGQVFELPALRGPGMTTHIWMTSHAGGVNELNALSLRIYWDDHETPGVEVPLGEPKPFGELPPYPDRFVPWEQHHLVRAFTRTQMDGRGNLGIQTAGFFGGRPVVVWRASKVGDRLTFPFTVREEGRYALRLTAFGSETPAVFDILLGDEQVCEGADFRGEDEIDLLLGTHHLTAGEHTLGFRARVAEAVLQAEILRLLNLPPEAIRTVKTHNEAHFIRLGIGRAVYAYRLAYGRLPESLEVLVQTGIMPARYLTDENGFPLRSRVEGDAFVVESTAPGGWKHRWFGLDARR